MSYPIVFQLGGNVYFSSAHHLSHLLRLAIALISFLCLSLVVAHALWNKPFLCLIYVCILHVHDKIWPTFLVFHISDNCSLMLANFLSIGVDDYLDLAEKKNTSLLCFTLVHYQQNPKLCTGGFICWFYYHISLQFRQS